MNLQEIDFTKTLTDDQVYESIMSNYSDLSKEWIFHQWNWMNSVYSSFNDHYKYLIIISLVEKTLQFFDQMNIQYNYDEYYSKSYLQIERFSITELCEKLDLPKETVRRKVLELEKEGVITRTKKKIVIDRKAFSFVKPENQIKFSSKYIYLVSKLLNKDHNFSKKLDQKFIETVIRKKFTLCWRWFYRMQIPLVIGYHKFFKDLTTFHIWGTICMNQVLNVTKQLDTPVDQPALDYFRTNNILIDNMGSDAGISAMSISDMTQIPRATIIRKCKYLVNEDLIKMNSKKQYMLSTMNFRKILPYQTEIFKFKAKFIRKVLNLLVIS
ncbi:DeoR family transcriptional regulator [Candidatus Pelagibacter communis]|uniref:DeoR family transcriptional regulator n=1 Tax=Pelagibacter ubique TaxID=198252 RepID=UPI000A55DE36|nr:DeoR family transcriptional regulator [Candidatus Pelagibacter ubique]